MDVELAGHHADAGSAAGAWLLLGLLVVVSIGLYLCGVAHTRSRRSRRWSRWRVAAWIAGTVAIGTALSPPLSAFGHADPRGHMVQHLLLGMYGPLALVLAAPLRLLLGASPLAARRPIRAVLRSPVVHLLSHPAVALLLNAGGLYLLYLTPLYRLSLQEPAGHALVHLHFLTAGFLFAWAIAGPDPGPRRPGLTTRVTVLLLATAAHAHLAKLLYARAGDLPPGTPYASDQLRQAAVWMYYGGDLAEVLLAVALFASWYSARGRGRIRTRAADPLGGWRRGHGLPALIRGRSRV